MSKRINVMVSDEINETLDNYGKRYGMSKSSIVGFVLGQWVDSMDKMSSTVFGATGNDGLLAELFKQMMSNSKK